MLIFIILIKKIILILTKKYIIDYLGRESLIKGDYKTALLHISRFSLDHDRFYNTLSSNKDKNIKIAIQQLFDGGILDKKLANLPPLTKEGFSLYQSNNTTKKQKLILVKKDLEEKISSFGRKSNNRFELAITFLKDTNQAEKYAQQENPEKNRDFLKKIGSNFRIADRALIVDFKKAWIIAEKYHVEVQRAKKNSYNFAKSAVWRRV